MNMNDKEWNEFWDNEPDEDEDEFNDVGSDVDANNDETFDNAAEWNEDEHEEMIARDSILSGWSPFGGKDLFNNPETPSQSQLAARAQSIMFEGQMPQSLTLDQQQQILMQQQQLLQQQLHQMAILKQQQIQQEQRLMSQNLKCFTVEELERQMVPTRSNNSDTKNFPGSRHICLPARADETKLKKSQDSHEMRGSSFEQRNDRFVRNESDMKGAREQRDRRDRKDLREHREQREHREPREPREPRESRESREPREYRDQREPRDYRDQREPRDYRDMRGHRNYRSKKLTIIPPQVQLRVLDKAKRFHSLTAMHSDEFLQDRMPTTKDGLLFKRHSTVLREKANHDGVLTERERNWLTKIQEKIQADYDDNLDQDYYYLLYFNRSSMTDEAAQKPCGPGVLDRRFIPRERLLYNSSA